MCFLVQLGLQLPEQYTLRAVATFMVTLATTWNLKSLRLSVFFPIKQDEFIKFSKTKKHLAEFMEQNAAGILEIVLLVNEI